jgi:Tfp pilus assembly protein PilP
MSALVLVLVVAALADAPQQQPAPAAPAPTAAPEPATAVDTYTYQPDGRRDPFVSVLRGGSEPRQASRRGEGLSGMLTADISVSGVMQSSGSFVALIQGPDKKTYLVHPGDKLMDGTIKTVAADGLTVVQDVNDPLSLAKTREVRKLLRSLEVGKP